MREAEHMSAASIGKAARRREPVPRGDEFLPPRFGYGNAPAGTGRQLQNPLAIQGGSRAMGQSYLKLMRAATSGKRRDKLNADEAQELMTQLVQGANLTRRPL